jgi:hypothetical protein
MRTRVRLNVMIDGQWTTWGAWEPRQAHLLEYQIQKARRRNIPFELKVETMDAGLLQGATA